MYPTQDKKQVVYTLFLVTFPLSLALLTKMQCLNPCKKFLDVLEILVDGRCELVAVFFDDVTQVFGVFDKQDRKQLSDLKYNFLGDWITGHSVSSNLRTNYY